MWRKSCGIPHGLNSQVIMCIADGLRLTKSKIRFGSCRFVTGSGLNAWTTSGNFIASRMKKTFRLLPTRSQLPSSLEVLGQDQTLLAGPRLQDLRRPVQAEAGVFGAREAVAAPPGLRDQLPRVL